MCWVAREVFGTETEEWMDFREWLCFAAPIWFFNLYANHGKSFAYWLKTSKYGGLVKLILKPLMRSVI
jgi:hypothetical protein